MARQKRVDFELRHGGSVSKRELRLILRAADDMIAAGGRALLSKVLKGSKEKRLLELGLQQNPSYGCFQSLSLDEILECIDWTIRKGYLAIEYSGKLPMLVFTDIGWEIEREQRANEFLREWDDWITSGVEVVSMEYLKDRNRGMILLFLQKIEESADPKYIPLLQRWQSVDYRKVQLEIQRVIEVLRGTG